MSIQLDGRACAAIQCGRPWISQDNTKRRITGGLVFSERQSIYREEYPDSVPAAKAFFDYVPIGRQLQEPRDGFIEWCTGTARGCVCLR